MEDLIQSFILNHLELVTGWVLSMGVIATFLVKAKKALKEVIEALQSVLDAIQDDSITKEELQKIAKEFSDIPKVFAKK